MKAFVVVIPALDCLLFPFSGFLTFYYPAAFLFANPTYLFLSGLAYFSAYGFS